MYKNQLLVEKANPEQAVPEQQPEFIGVDMANGKDETVTETFNEGGVVPAPTFEELNTTFPQQQEKKEYNMHEDFFDFCAKYNLGSDAIVELSELLEKHMQVNF